MGSKVKNAKQVTFGGITFRSELECNVYKILVEAGFKPAYEKRLYTLIEPLSPTVPFFTKSKKSKKNKTLKTNKLKLDMKELEPTTYLPDFTFKYKGYFIIVEAKGYKTDEYKIKIKLFRSLMEKTKEFDKIMFFEVYHENHVLQMIDILKQL